MVVHSDQILIHQVTTSSDRKKFVRVPYELHQGKENWVFPLDFDSLERIDPKKNPFFEFGDAAFWLATVEGRPLGRISAQINQRHLDRYQDETGHFGYLDAIDDQNVFQKLIETAQNWLKDRGMKRIAGPFQLSINEECGLLVKGFDHPAMLLMGHSEPYYSQHVEDCGFQKMKDLLAFKIDALHDKNSKIERMLKAGQDTSVHIRKINLKKIDQEIAIVFDIFEDAWSQNWGFVPFSKGELKHMAASMKMILNPDLAYIAERKGEPFAMLICLPNLNEAIADLNGKLLPFGWAKLLWRLKVKGLKSGRVVLAGVKQEFHGTMTGMAALGAMMSSLNENALKIGMDYAEMSWILEDNKQVQRLLSMGGYSAYKTYRLYDKEL